MRDAVRVLIVDDEEPVRRFAGRVLRMAGYDVQEAADGATALEVAAQHGPFALAVIDLMMPGISGGELARQLRRDDQYLKVLYFTGYSDQLFAGKPTLWQGEAFLDKPVTIEALQQAVSLLLFGHTRGPAPTAA